MTVQCCNLIAIPNEVMTKIRKRNDYGTTNHGLIKRKQLNRFIACMIDTVEDPTYGIAYDIYKVQAIMLLPKQDYPRFQMVKGTLMEQVQSCLL